MKTETVGLLFLISAFVAVPVALGSTPAWITAAEAATASKLGDLAMFRKIVTDTAVMVDKGDLPSAVKRIKDLEVAWDDAEPSLRPRAAADWHRIDDQIDKTLDALRANKPDPAACKKTLTDLLSIMDNPTGA